MISLDAGKVDSALDYEELIERIRLGFSLERAYGIPKRHHHHYPNPPSGEDSTLLMMPAWEAGKSLGVKIVNVTPENGKIGLPSIHGIYLFFDAKTGIPEALMDSNMITKKRTAATSALASKFLSGKDSSSLLMIGTGALAPELIKAHLMVRQISRVLIWGRDVAKAEKLAGSINLAGVEIKAVSELKKAVMESDIISAATLSKTPLIKGSWLKDGQHIDLVGSYRPDMREADDDVIRKASVFVDSYEGATIESGDLAIPLSRKIIAMKDIKADLFELCKLQKTGRTSDREITCFKSVGHALEDLIAAQLVYEKYKKANTDE